MGIVRLPRWLSGKDFICQTGDEGSIPGSGRSPGEEMATHSSILAWEILWTEELGRLQSMGLQRVRHDLAAKLTVVTFKKDKQGSNWEKVSRAPEMLEIFYFLT